MAQPPQPNPPQLTFPDVLTFGDFPADQQDLPKAYRQRHYQPDQTTQPGWDLQSFGHAAFNQLTSPTLLTRTFMWPRLLWKAETRLNEYLRRMADVRNPLLITARNPPQENSRYPPQSDVQMLHQSLCGVFEPLFAVSMLQVNDPRDNPNLDIRRFNDVVTSPNDFVDFCHRLTAIPAAMRYREDRRMQVNTGGLRPKFLWMEDFQRSLDESLQHLGAAWNWARDRNKTIDDGIQAALENVPEMTRLLAFILEREEIFYDELVREHIFGCLNDKRIKLLSPSQLSRLHDIYLRPGGSLFSAYVRDDIFYKNIYRDRLADLYRRLKNYQLSMLELFDHRQLVEWGYRPLYSKLYVVVSDELGISAQTVREFQDWADFDHHTQNIFAVRPVVPTHFAGEDCIVCMEELVPVQGQPQGVTVMELYCGHRFHPQCVLPIFDGLNKWTNRCPLCRQAAGPLRDMVSPYFAEVGQDTDYELQHGQSQTDIIVRNWMRTNVVNLDLRIHDHVGGSSHEAWWNEQIYEYLEWRRARREQRRSDNAFWYGYGTV